MLGALVTSCDMNLEPQGSLSTDTSELSFDDMTKLRMGLYPSFRSLSSGSYITIPELMMDKFNGTLDNGNRNGLLANKLFNSSTGEFETIYYNEYSAIAAANFVMQEIEKFKASNTVEGEDALLLERYEGEAKFFRAYYYWYLFEHFCQPYTADKAQTPALGLSLQLTYAPGGISSNYPGRSTMEETLNAIKSDLTDAYNALVAYEAMDDSDLQPETAYLSSDVVKAFEARVCLAIGDYAGAIAAAEPVVTSKRYELVPATAYESLWLDDSGTELIMLPSASASEGGGIGIYGIYNSTSVATSSDYIPCEDILLAYEEGDVRMESFFNAKQLNIQTQNYITFAFNKYPGNAAMAGNGRLNKSKPFRASELYLILAEAYAVQGTTPAKGLDYLNDLLEARYEAGTFTDLALQGSALIDRIREERAKELIGEGFRFGDLRRWGIGFTRSIDYPVIDQVAQNPVALKNALNPLGGRVVYEAGDSRYTWPIPSAEMDINPQLAGQQNPGY